MVTSDLNGSIDKVFASLETPKNEIWKLVFEIYKIEVNKSIQACDIVHGSFHKHLKNVKDDIKKGYNLLGEIYLELKMAKRNGSLHEINTTELDFCLKKLLELFGPTTGQRLKEKSELRADNCSEMLEHQMEVINKRGKDVNRVVTISLTTAGLGLAGFATAIGASAKTMVYENLKSQYLLRVSGGGLALAVVAQLAEYLDYNDNFNSIVHDLKTLRESLAELLIVIDNFSVELTDLIEAINHYYGETKKDTLLLSNHCSKDESFLARIYKMCTRAKELQIFLVRMETYIEGDTEFIQTSRAELTKKHFPRRGYQMKK